MRPEPGTERAQLRSSRGTRPRDQGAHVAAAVASKRQEHPWRVPRAPLHAVRARGAPEIPATLPRLDQDHFEHLHEAIERCGCVVGEPKRRKEAMTPAEGGGGVDSGPPCGFTEWRRLGHTKQIGRPRWKSLGVGERRSGEIAEGATAGRAAVALASAVAAPALRAARPAARTVEAGREAAFPDPRQDLGSGHGDGRTHPAASRTG